VSSMDVNNENTQSQNPNRYVSGVYKLLYRYILKSDFKFLFQFSEDSRSIISDSHPRVIQGGGGVKGATAPPRENYVYDF
jgi:hypothetical protein